MAFSAREYFLFKITDKKNIALRAHRIFSVIKSVQDTKCPIFYIYKIAITHQHQGFIYKNIISMYIIKLVLPDSVNLEINFIT